MHLQLQMVGFYKNKNVRIKGHVFLKGLTTIDAGPDYCAGITKYLSGWGAFPVHEAEKRQAILDVAEGKEITMTVSDSKVERLKVQLALAEQERGELVEIRTAARAEKALKEQDRIETEAATQILVRQKLAERKAQAELLLAQVEVEDDAVPDTTSPTSAGSQEESNPPSFRSGKNKNK